MERLDRQGPRADFRFVTSFLSPKVTENLFEQVYYFSHS